MPRPTEDYKAIIDEECKVRARTPNVSKFRHMPFDFSDDERCQIYQQYVKSSGRSRANNVAAFFRATFDAWKDYKRTGRETFYVGYSPILVVDAGKILTELPQAHFLHVVRNPWSAYADTKKRPVPLSLRHYMLGWTLNQYHALILKERFPSRFHIVRAEDVMSDPYDDARRDLRCAGLGACRFASHADLERQFRSRRSIPGAPFARRLQSRTWRLPWNSPWRSRRKSGAIAGNTLTHSTTNRFFVKCPEQKSFNRLGFIQQ